MESQGISQSRAPSWGAPASKSTPRSDQSLNVRQNFNRGGQSYRHDQTPVAHNYQRSSPYHRDHRGRGATTGSTFQNGRQHSDSPGFQSPGQNFSPQNPFASQAHSFSNDNPYQSKGQTFSPNNPFQKNSPNSSPHFQHAQFQSTPVSSTPGMTNRVFSPRTPNTPFQKNSPNSSPHFQHTQFQSTPVSQTPGMAHRAFSPRTQNTPFYTPSPRHSSKFRGNPDSSQHFNRRNSSMGNPGGSGNIQDYISCGMLEDPWRDLPPKPILQ